MTTTLGGQQSGSIWDLSLYEVHRKPHEVVTDDSLIGVSPRALHSELMCPICLDLMKNAQTTKECLHRFCQECIITALRSGNKECPTCRKKLVSKRSLRSDPNFDALIAKIYPNRDELTQQQEKFRPPHPPLHQLARRKRVNDTQADVPVSSESPSPDEKKPKLYPEEDLSDLDPEDNGSKGDDEEEEESRIEFQLRPHPCDESVSGFDIRTLATSPDATVAHLVKFLGLIQNPTGNTGEKMQTSLDKFSISTLCSSDEGSYVTLEGTTSLKEICDNHWTPGEKMKLYYSANSYSS